MGRRKKIVQEAADTLGALFVFHFAIGDEATQADWQSFADALPTDWFLPASLVGKVTIYPYHSGTTQDPSTVATNSPANIADSIMANQPTGDIYLIGFSFGGWQVVLATAALKAAGRIVHVMELDPVNWNRNQLNPGDGPDPGESIVGAVEVVCITRTTNTVAPPWSFSVINTPNTVNTSYGVNHGDQVSNCPVTQQYLLNAVNTGKFITTPETSMTISTQPLSQSIPAGSPVTFTATVTGAGSGLASLWQVSSDGKTFTNIVGSSQMNGTTAIYSIPAVTPGMNGMEYRCFFNSLGNTVLSSNAILTVSSAPSTPPQISNVKSIVVTCVDGSFGTFVPQS